MAAFDVLPAEIRGRLAEAPAPISPEHVLEVLRAAGKDRVLEMLANTIKADSAVYAAALADGFRGEAHHE